MRLATSDRPRLAPLTIIGFDLQKRLSYNFGSKMGSVKVSQGPDSKFIFYGVTVPGQRFNKDQGDVLQIRYCQTQH